MWNKIKRSLVAQTQTLFILSFIVIIALWVAFYFQQKNQHFQRDLARYFNTAGFIKSYHHRGFDVNNEDLEHYDMKFYDKRVCDKPKVLFERKIKRKGFRVIEDKGQKILHLRTREGDIFLVDTSRHGDLIVIHLVFLLLLITQGLLYLKLRSSLNPIATLHEKLKELEKGDLSPVKIETKYEEIDQMVKSYNGSIGKIEYILELREMFNKIFMHEMKMPMAKGMFYLKQEPSKMTHEKLLGILNNMNDELNEFAQIESLIAYQNKIDMTEHNFIEILDEVKRRLVIEDPNIEIINLECGVLKGDREFWTLCIKNLVDNALKYSEDKKLIIDCSEAIEFKNRGEELPVDISKDIKKWKIDKEKRHKSSTGYGFGLFIIKNIVTLHGYKLEYTYNADLKEVSLKII